MKKKIILSLAIVVIMGMLADSLNAQIRPRRHHRRPTRIKQASAVGFRVGNDFEKDQYFVGGHFWLPLGVLLGVGSLLTILNRVNSVHITQKYHSKISAILL